MINNYRRRSSVNTTVVYYIVTSTAFRYRYRNRGGVWVRRYLTRTDFFFHPNHLNNVLDSRVENGG